MIIRSGQVVLEDTLAHLTEDQSLEDVFLRAIAQEDAQPDAQPEAAPETDQEDTEA